MLRYFSRALKDLNGPAVAFIRRGSNALWVYPRTNRIPATLTFHCSLSSETPKSPSLANPPHIGNEDVLSEQVRKADSTERIMELVDTHHSMMNNKHILLTLEAMFYLNKNRRSAANMEGNQQFQKLCNRVLMRARFFENVEVINLIKYLTFLGVSSKTTLVQSLFQLLRHGINDLTLQQIIYLEFLLKKQETVPLVEALKIALPLVLESKINQQLNPDNIQEIVNVFQYAANNNLSSSSLQKLVSTLLESKGPMEFPVAFNCFWGLYALSSNIQGAEMLIQNVFNVLSVNIDKIPKEKLVAMLGRCRSSNHLLYNEAFFSAVCNKIQEENWDIASTQSIVFSLKGCNYANLPLLENFSSMIESKFDQFKQLPTSIYSVFDSFSRANYKPKNANKLWPLLCSQEELIHKIETRTPHLFLDMLCIMLHFGYRDEKLLKSAFEPAFVSTLLSEIRLEKKLKNVLSFLLLQKFAGGSIDSRTLEELNMLVEPFRKQALQLAKSSVLDYPLRGALERGIGGKQYIQTGVMTKFGVHIDHVVILRKGNYPVAVGNSNKALESDQARANDEFVFVEDLSQQGDATSVAVLAHSHTAYPKNIQRLRSYFAFRGEVLKHCGFVPVHISLPVWSSLPEHERIPYLMRAIKENVNETSSKASSQEVV